MKQTETINFSYEARTDGVYVLSGTLTGAVLAPFLAQLSAEKSCTLDFTDVSAINFSGIRALLNAREAGKSFVISGANAAVAELFETTGASKFISVCRAPQEIDLREWVKSGYGHTAESFDHADGDAMMKLYFDFVPDAAIEQEKRVAQAAFLMGIPTPMPGKIICADGRRGCCFERLANKRSFFRLISQEPERLEEIVVRFAKMAKKLHATPCDKTVFPSYKEKVTKIIRNQGMFTDEERQKLLCFLNSVEDTGMCIHGDLHGGNVITDGTVDLFIDMGDFCYGNPLFDIGALFVMPREFSEDRVLHEFHISRDTYRQFWVLFAREYFGADTPEKLSEVNRMMMPYAAFQALILLEHDAADPVFPPFIREAMQYM